MAQPPRIFVDQDQPSGVEWPLNLRDALQKSRLLVAVWTPPFFQSRWCQAEWASMLLREEVMESARIRPARGLVYPVVYSDGQHFDERAKATQWKRDLRDFGYPYPSFKDSPAYLRFHDAVRDMAEEIDTHLAEIPDWSADWPVAELPPIAAGAGRFALPTL